MPPFRLDSASNKHYDEGGNILMSKRLIIAMWEIFFSRWWGQLLINVHTPRGRLAWWRLRRVKNRGKRLNLMILLLFLIVTRRLQFVLWAALTICLRIEWNCTIMRSLWSVFPLLLLTFFRTFPGWEKLKLISPRWPLSLVLETRKILPTQSLAIIHSLLNKA
jgi:hypothetical protein